MIPALITIAIVGVFWMWSFNAAFSALQLIIEDRLRGRVMAIVNTIGFGTMPLGALLVSLIATVHDRGTQALFTLNAAGQEASPQGVRLGLIVLSSALVLCGLVWLRWRTPEIDGLEVERKPGLWNGLTARNHRPRA
jgi:hypothetical protein